MEVVFISSKVNMSLSSAECLVPNLYVFGVCHFVHHQAFVMENSGTIADNLDVGNLDVEDGAQNLDLWWLCSSSAV